MFLSSPGTKLASLVVFISASLWGVYWMPLHYLEGQGISGTTAVALLNLPAALPLLLLMLWQWQRYRGFIQHALIIGILTGLAIAFYSSGVVYSSVVRSTLLFYLTPVWATLIEMFWLREKVTANRWLAVTGGLIGMTLLLSNSSSVALGIGDVLAFLSGIFWALGAAMIKRFDQVPLPGMTGFQFLFTGLAAISVGYLMQTETPVTTAQLMNVAPVVGPLSMAIILPSVLAVFWGQKFITPGRASLLMMSEVLVAVISASLLLPNEKMTLIEWSGAVLIISACFFEVFSTSAKASEKSLPTQQMT